MLARVYSCAVVGLEGVIVEVEVDYSNGLPAVIIVGLPDAAVQESRERVQTAVKNAGLHFPRHRIVVNLAPASVRKEGPAYDLPIALGVIVLAGFLPHDADRKHHCHRRTFAGWDGPSHARRFADGRHCPRQWIQADVRPRSGRREAALIPDLEVIPVKSLADLFDHLSGRRFIEPYQPTSS